jgi:hypothetical protein
MIVHSANNLKKEKKKKKKRERKRKRKEKKKKNKRGHKINSIEPHALIMIWPIPFKHGQVILYLC